MIFTFLLALLAMTIKCKAVSIDRDDTAYEVLATKDGSFAEVNTQKGDQGVL